MNQLLEEYGDLQVCVHTYQVEAQHSPSQSLLVQCLQCSAARISSFVSYSDAYSDNSTLLHH